MTITSKQAGEVYINRWNIHYGKDKYEESDAILKERVSLKANTYQYIFNKLKKSNLLCCFKDKVNHIKW